MRNTFNTNIFKNTITMGLLHIGLVPTESEILFAAVFLPPKGIGELLFSDGSDDPILVRLGAVLGQ
jgi:hypothetical protein